MDNSVRITDQVWAGWNSDSRWEEARGGPTNTGFYNTRMDDGIIPWSVMASNSFGFIQSS